MDVFGCIAVLILTYLFYVIFFKSQSISRPPAPVPAQESGEKKKRRLVVLFIDAPDPDNPASAAAIIKHILATTQGGTQIDSHLHIVLTGRPVDLKTAKDSSGVLLLESIPRQAWEEEEPLHAQKVLEDAAARLENYLKKCNVDVSNVTIYDGGVAPCAPLSDRVHDWDFLFDRKDLVTQQEADRGSILTPEEYKVLVDEISSLSAEEREQKLLSLLRPYMLSSLLPLRSELEKKTCDDVVLFLGGPATALVQLFKGEIGSKIRPKVVSLYGMFGSLQPGVKTLLPNQFNVACDIEAACNLFVSNLFPQAEKYLITTETAKSEALMLSSQVLQKEGIASYFVELQRLWEYTHKGKAQPLFDVFPVMAFMEPFRGYFKWHRKKAVLQEVQRRGPGEDAQQIFCFADSDDDRHVLVSETHTRDLDKELFVKFLQKTWT